ncbi:EF-P beta-lysylation protein EpmB [Marinobacteraceae bacterium S3BR75-40.1]
MIQRTPARIEAQEQNTTPRWQQALARAITDPRELLARLQLPDALLPGAEDGQRLFPIRVPEPFLQRMEAHNPDDPLLRQVLPLQAESQPAAGFVIDPLQEQSQAHGNGLIRKYRSRALLVLTGACAVNCRYCFRRHFPYNDYRLQPSDWEPALEVLRQAPEINEVILSGGDPLAMNDRLLARLVAQLETIPHIRRLRLHTRLPVVIPQRVDDSLFKWLAASRLQKIVVLHINHAREIDASVREAVQRLRDAGATLLNQSVILQGVNDSVAALSELSDALFDAGVLPYYLHAFDPVAGAAHFAVSDEHARTLVRQLHGVLPGYLVPRLVREIPGEASKSPLDLGMA